MKFAVLDDRGWRAMCALALLAMLLWCGYALHATKLLSQPMWNFGDGTGTAFAVLGIISLAVAWLCARLRLAFFLVTAAILLVVSALIAGVGPAAVVVLILVSSCFLGRTVMLGAEGDALPLLSMAVGLAIFSFVITLLTFTHWNNPATYLLLILLPFAVRPGENWRRLAADFLSWRTTTTSGIEIPLHAVAFMALVIQLWIVLLPELGGDALGIHIHVLDFLRSAGTFPYDRNQLLQSFIPMAVDWVYSLAGMLAGEPAARLLNMAAELITAGLIYTVASRSSVRFAGPVAVLMYIATPLLYLETSSLFIENLWVLWLFAAAVCAQRSMRDPHPRWVIGAAILLGTAMAAKVITIFAVPYFIWVGAHWWRRPATAWWRTAVAALLVTAAGIIPYANAWWKTGNPVFPFMNDVFKSPLFDTGGPFRNALFEHHADFRLLYDVTFNSTLFLESRPGAMGLLWFVLLPIMLLVIARTKPRWLPALLASVLMVVGVFAFQSYLRYILPVLPFLAVATGVALTWLTESSRTGRILVTCILVTGSLAGLYLYPSVGSRYEGMGLPPFHGSSAEAALLGKLAPGRLLPPVINALQLKKVLWIGPPQIAGTLAEIQTPNWSFPDFYKTFVAANSIGSLRQLIVLGNYDAIAVVGVSRACTRPVFCDFLQQYTTTAYERNDVALHVVDQRRLYEIEMLLNPDFVSTPEPWQGNGTYDAASGSVVVTGLAWYSQTVAVQAGRKYLLESVARCQNGPYRMQVSWMNAAHKPISDFAKAVFCTRDFETTSEFITAPPQATSVKVFAIGHHGFRDIEISRVSMRGY